MKKETQQLQHEGKTTGEINITIQIDKKIRKKKLLDGTSRIQFAAPVR